MTRGQPRRPLNEEIRDLQLELEALTIRLAVLEDRADDAQQRPLIIGDRVSFQIAGRYAEGVIIGSTAQRVRIRANSTLQVYLRAEHNVRRLA